MRPYAASRRGPVPPRPARWMIAAAPVRGAGEEERQMEVARLAGISVDHYVRME